MRKRIFLFHTLTLLASLLILLFVSGAAVDWARSIYDDHRQQMEAPQFEQVCALLEDACEDAAGWEALSLTLSKAGHNLIVLQDGEPVFSSLDPFQEKICKDLPPSVSWPEDSVLPYMQDGMMVLGRQCGDYTLMAMRTAGVPDFMGRQRSQSNAMRLSLLVSGAAAICIILLFATFLTRSQIRRVMRPVNALTDAARRVENGDLSTPVEYHAQDEFSVVCAAFDQMQARLREEREKNAAYERARTDLVAGISHDLRTPLTSVKGYLQGLRDGIASTPEKQRQYLDIAYRKACDMEKLLQQLFYFSKMETGGLPLTLEATDFGEFLQSAVREVQGELQALGGAVTLEASPGPHPVQIDAEQMYRVLTNLVGNAVRYANTSPLHLTLTLERDGAHERLRFADNGLGVPEEQLPDLFRQFWRGDAARGSRGGKGSGLGLYIVRHIVEAHGGTITAHNDNGLVFTITLPGMEAA